MCFILHVFIIHVSCLTLLEHTLSPVMLPCHHGIFCPVFLSHFIATACSAPLFYISLHPLLWSFLLFLLRYPLTICFVRYRHCDVKLAMTPLPSLPSSHRFTSTSQIVATTLFNPAKLFHTPHPGAPCPWMPESSNQSDHLSRSHAPLSPNPIQSLLHLSIIPSNLFSNGCSESGTVWGLSGNLSIFPRSHAPLSPNPTQSLLHLSIILSISFPSIT
jgi:hypothetical protein